MNSEDGMADDRVQWRTGSWMAAVTWLAIVAAAVTAADDAKAPARPSLKAIKADLDAASDLLADGRPTKAVAKLSTAIAGIEQVTAESGTPSGLRALLDRCKAVKSDLELEGVDVSGITLPTLKTAAQAAASAKPAPAEGEPAMKKNADEFFGRPPPRPAMQAVSFSKDVAPVLVRSCGGCHISGKKGGFQFTNYASLMQTGVVQRGAGEASRLVEVILSGDMPRGGSKVSPDEIGALMKWIDAGAAFDGPDPAQPLALLGTAAKPTAREPAPRAAVVMKLEPGAVSFSGDIAPIFLKSCYSCHGGNDDVEEGFSIKTFDRLLAGGRSGRAITPGRGADSLLVKKIRGKDIEGQRMPLNRTPLTDDVIAMIERWITEGARLDARSAQQDLPTVAAFGRSRKLSHEDLLEVRLAAAKNLWGRSLPDTQPEMAGAGDVRLIGNLSPTRTKSVAAAAESAWKGIERELADGSRPLKGGLIVYAFDKKFDFSEFWQVRFGRERPSDIIGVGDLSGDIAYAALAVPTADDGPDTELLVTEQMAAAIMAARGVPRWFSTGMGRAMAATLVPRAPLVKAWRMRLPDALAALGSADQFFSDDTADSEDQRIVAGGFVGAIIGKGPRGQALLAQLDADTPFDQAFTAVFGGPPAQLFPVWAAKEAAGSRRR